MTVLEVFESGRAEVFSDRPAVCNLGNRGLRVLVFRLSDVGDSDGNPKLFWQVFLEVGEASVRVSRRRPVLPLPKDLLLTPVAAVLSDSFGRCDGAIMGGWGSDLKVMLKS